MPVLGLVYILVLALIVLLCVQIYRKAMPWQDAVDVTLTTPNAGLQLNPLSDVKLQGVRVGEVRQVTSDGVDAVVHMALDPDRVQLVPRNVDAAILPKTLFGEKFVDLRPRERSSTDRISEGDVLRQSTTSVELSALFSHLVSVLDVLKPEQLSLTLNSLADALAGRGAKLGETIDLLHRLLGRFNPHLNTLTHDIRQFAATADIYADNAPNLLRTLANGVDITRDLLVPKEKDFSAFLDTAFRTADAATDVLRANADSLVTLAGEARPVAALLDEYSSEFPCLIHSLNVTNAAVDKALAQGPYVNLSVEVITQRAPYTYPEDLPQNPSSDANNANIPAPIPSWSPHCPVIPERMAGLADVPPLSQREPRKNVLEGRPERPEPGATAGLTPRQGLARALAAQLMEVPADQVPGAATLLLEPLLSDGKVRVR